MYSGSPVSTEASSQENVNVFGQSLYTFVDDDGISFDVFSLYRNSIKDRWKLFWPIEVLRWVDQHHELDNVAKTLLKNFDDDITYPMEGKEILEVIKPYLSKHCDSFTYTGVHDSHVDHEIVRPRISKDNANKMMQRWLEIAESFIVKSLPHLQNDLSSCSSLEIGCGKGYLTHALKCHGFNTSIGIDSTKAGYSSLNQNDEVIAVFSSHGELKVMNVEKTDFNDNQFDLIISTSVLEHISNIPAAFKEMARILKPGGTIIHNFDPFFSPGGGHSLCILDFPWGHARLSPDSFESYLKKYRPHEVSPALDFYHNQFNQPRITLAEIQYSLLEAGFCLHEWTEHKYSSHIPLVTTEIINQVKRHYPTAEMRDLITSGVQLVATL